MMLDATEHELYIDPHISVSGEKNYDVFTLRHPIHFMEDLLMKPGGMCTINHHVTPTIHVVIFSFSFTYIKVLSLLSLWLRAADNAKCRRS